MEMQKNLESIIKKNEELKKIKIVSNRESITIYQDEWQEMSEKRNVFLRPCVLNFKSKDKTIVNVYVSEGGYIAPHSHDRVESIYVLDGFYTDIVTGKTYSEGEIQVINPEQMHGLISDYCILTIVWKPKFDEYFFYN